jgi:hypothetical protein
MVPLGSMEYGDRSLRGGLFAAATALLFAAVPSGCGDGSECEGCDADELVLLSISGVNYAGNAILIDAVRCEGARCPTASSANEPTCSLADGSEFGAATEADCRLSPLVTAEGVDFAFNNALERASIQLQRRSPINPGQERPTPTPGRRALRA